MEERYDIFLSYSTRDEGLAKELSEKFDRAGLKCFMSEKNIKPGEKWSGRIHDALKYSTHVILLVTPRSLSSEWVKLETGAAWALDKEVIPVLRGVDAEELNDVLKMYQARDIETQEGIEKLVAYLSGIIDFTAFWHTLFSKRDPEKNIYVLLSAKKPMEYEILKLVKKPGHTVLVSYNELEAFLKFQRELESSHEKIRVVHGGVFVGESSEGIENDEIPKLPLKWIEKDCFVDQDCKEFSIPEFPLNENLIILGSTHANLVCREIMSHPSLENPPFKFEMVEMVEKDNKKHKCIKTEAGFYPTRDNQESVKKISDQVEEDYGILLRATNPFDKNEKNKVLILGGNHGFGTQAAMKFVANRGLIKFLRSKVYDSDFEAVFRAKVDKNYASELDLKILRIAKREDSKWEIVYVASD